MGHVTMTTPVMGYFIILRLGLEKSIPYTKFDDSSLNRSKYMIGAPKVEKMGHLNLTTRLLGVVCYP